MAYETLTVAVEGAVGRLTLHQPEVLNPLGSDTLRELVDAARWFDTTDAVVVVVTGAGRAFSAGFDLREFAAGGPDRTTASRESADLGRRMAEAVEAMRAVTIAAIHGPCVGGGLVLAAACDLRIAADDTRFSIPEVDLGIPLAWGGVARLVREIGPAATRELVLTCRPFDANEAKALRFVNRVVQREQLESAVDELVGQLVDKAPSVVRATKRQVNEATESLASTAGAWADADALVGALMDPEARAAAVRYLAARNRG